MLGKPITAQQWRSGGILPEIEGAGSECPRADRSDGARELAYVLRRLRQTVQPLTASVAIPSYRPFSSPSNVRRTECGSKPTWCVRSVDQETWDRLAAAPTPLKRFMHFRRP